MIIMSSDSAFCRFQQILITATSRALTLSKSTNLVHELVAQLDEGLGSSPLLFAASITQDWIECESISSVFLPTIASLGSSLIPFRKSGASPKGTAKAIDVSCEKDDNAFGVVGRN